MKRATNGRAERRLMKKILIAGILALGVVTVPALAQETGHALAGSTKVSELSERTLAKGLTFEATFKDQISSQKNKIGEIVTGVIVADVKDAAGVVIFPANSAANVEIMDIKGVDKDHTDGALALVVRSVNVGNQTFRIQTAKDSVSSTWTRQPKKMESQSASGSVASPVLVTGVVGRAPKGALNGTNLIVKSGTAVTFELAEAVTVTS